ncbi:ACT domain-containing protein [Kineococcus auxinigenes]|uniref:ACT domain-containing protein n=1 Tax=unclassified Kineococcus TaxID=2621656 RepID=UPI003D7EBF24
MSAPGGERDLAVLLRSLRPVRRPGEFAYRHLPPGSTVADVPRALEPAATVVEDEGLTLVLPAERAAELGEPAAGDERYAWISLEVHSALDAVGLTAALSRALTDAGIPANVLAGRFHDHVLVPVERAEQALRVLTALSGADQPIT